MAKFELKFFDCEDKNYHIMVERITENDEYDLIQISGSNYDEFFQINLDKSTAIKFAKTLRTEINKIKEVTNGGE